MVRAVVAALSLAVGALPQGSSAEEAEWVSLFDGATLGDWRPTPFGGGEAPAVVDGAIRIPPGADLNGVTWGGTCPRQSYELALEARRVDGGDFFCGVTFPVGESCCTLVLGGWGGAVTGLSCIDGRDAGDNETTDTMTFESGRWYDVRVRVTPERIECLVDGEVIVDQPIEHRRIDVRAEVIPSQPLGIATYATTGEARRIRWREMPAP